MRKGNASDAGSLLKHLLPGYGSRQFTTKSQPYQSAGRFSETAVIWRVPISMCEAMASRSSLQARPLGMPRACSEQKCPRLRRLSSKTPESTGAATMPRHSQSAATCPGHHSRHTLLSSSRSAGACAPHPRAGRGQCRLRRRWKTESSGTGFGAWRQAILGPCGGRQLEVGKRTSQDGASCIRNVCPVPRKTDCRQCQGR